MASIGENGLLEPIAVWRGEVIDGRHRLRACAEAGVEPRFSQLEDATDPVEYVLARNEARRHLDDSQRAVAAYKLSAGSRPGPAAPGRRAECKFAQSFQLSPRGRPPRCCG